MSGDESDPIEDVEQLRLMSEFEFVRVWRAVLGEPPSIMLERDAMIAMLLQERVTPLTDDRALEAAAAEGAS